MILAQALGLRKESLRFWGVDHLTNSDKEIEVSAILFSIAPWALGGVCIQTNDLILKNTWIQFLKKLLPSSYSTLSKIPFNIELDALVGGVDISSSILTGKLVNKTGILNQQEKKIFILKRADQLSEEIACCLCRELDSKALNKNNFFNGEISSFIAFDESSHEDDEEKNCGIHNSLIDRLSILLSFPSYSSKNNCNWNFIVPPAAKLAKARDRLVSVELGNEHLKTIASVSIMLGIQSLRPVILTSNVAKIIAAYEDRLVPIESDIKLAIRLVLLPRAQQIPQNNNDGQDSEADEKEQDNKESFDVNKDLNDKTNTGKDEDRLNEKKENYSISNFGDDENEKKVETISSNIPRDLLNEIAKGEVNFSTSNQQGFGKKGVETKSKIGKGRFFGSKKGKPCASHRLNFLETIKASIPHQKVRRKEYSRTSNILINIQTEDFRVFKRKSRQLTTTVFLVDASGSSASNRLGEAKGAVELLLSECYVRRDRVAVITFRNKKSELVLPPTRSLVRAKKTLAGMAGGGGTPLATALDDCKKLVKGLLSENQTPYLVLLTDGGANVCIDGKGGRDQAHAEALISSKEIKNLGINSVFIDTSIIANDKAMMIANSMGAKYCPLPKANSSKIIEQITNQ